MNKFLMILLFSYTLLSCNIRKDKTNADAKATDSTAHQFKDSTTVQIIDSVYNFGKLADGEKVEYSFRFKNTGENPLIISSASASCGCTVPEKPEEPIKPGETGFIKVVFNSQGRIGDTHKEVNVISNAYPAFPPLALRGEVVAAKK